MTWSSDHSESWDGSTCDDDFSLSSSSNCSLSTCSSSSSPMVSQPTMFSSEDVASIIKFVHVMNSSPSEEKVYPRTSPRKKRSKKTRESLRKTSSKSVSFDLSFNELYEIEPLCDISKREKCKLWYSRRDYLQIRKENDQTVALVLNCCGLNLEDFGKCFRGLEFHDIHGHDFTSARSDRRELLINQAYDAVFDAQEDLWDANACNPEMIAMMYREISEICEAEARQTGALDAQQVSSWTKQRDVTPKVPRRRWGSLIAI